MSAQPPPSPIEASHHTSSTEASNQSSTNPSRTGSIGGDTSRQKHKHARVKFSIGSDDDDDDDEGGTVGQEASSNTSQPVLLRKPLPHQRLLPLIDTDASADVTDVSLKAPDWTGRTRLAAETAQQKASHLANRLSRSAPGSRRNSVETARRPQVDGLISPSTSPLQYPVGMVGLQGIPLVDMSKLNRLERESTRRPYSIYEDETESDSDAPATPTKPLAKKGPLDRTISEAHRLVKTMSKSLNLHSSNMLRGRKLRHGTAVSTITTTCLLLPSLGPVYMHPCSGCAITVRRMRPLCRAPHIMNRRLKSFRDHF
jgi:hypothetical protein